MTDLLALLAWTSPAFPTGAFACSHGLEWAVEAGDIRDEATLLAWLEDILTHGSGRNELILLRAAHGAWADTEALAALARAAATTRERQAETVALGTAFAAAAAPWSPPPLPEHPPYPVALGALAGAHGLDVETTAAAAAQGFATNLISAAVRLVPLGQSAGLRVLAALAPAIRAVVAETRGATPADLGGAAFRSDLAAMRHETQYTRLFRT
ncbi:MAG: urease accessory protein UreF [Acetobacteraceae bacterium]